MLILNILMFSYCWIPFPQNLVPDVGRAIYLNQLYPELKTERRMENLERQRKGWSKYPASVTCFNFDND